MDDSFSLDRAFVEGYGESADMDLSQIEGFLRSQPGVIIVRKIPPSLYSSLHDHEAQSSGTVLFPVHNLGSVQATLRENILALLKDKNFRKPALPTVYLVVEATPGDRQLPVLEIAGKAYVILGQEIMPVETEYAEKTLQIGDSFVLFPERIRSNRKPSYYLLPPLPFPELEAKQHIYKIRDVISASLSSTADTYLRAKLGFELTDTSATLVIGFNSR